MSISERSQTAIVWWSIIFTVMYGVALGVLLHMIPPPPATDSVQQIAHWYQNRHTEIKIGATIASYTGAFMLPLWAVITVQIARQERGRPIWAIMAATGGSIMTFLLVLPPLFWGVAAYTPDRAPEATALMHQLGTLTLVTTDQYFIFSWVAIIVICFLPQTAAHSPFPRWFGYFSAWIALMFEAGAIAFNVRTGPFAWNGLLVFWSPIILFALWLIVMSYLLLKNLKLQRRDAEAEAKVAELVAV